ncbi:DUF2147 domain-containing protein [Parahaliea mediterranea]|uniref:DUF2147 domain-containing protein n=1 Tax=Parahaliea mediterranea TaxID=651086 RepID=A0A939IKY9_9GAMM|nr:DUF2147 domain-containing protein [Parahaliea mediterranea]MBN7797836.1 DUF2147 domain-containing protein [Parahaliea mediterranea]
MPQRLIISLLIAVLAPLAVAADPAGRWRTIDDDTGEARSIVEISMAGGTLSGKVLRLFNPTEPNPRCTQCSGEREGQPIEGMTVLWGLVPEDGEWVDGRVLDPESGKEYNAKVKLVDDGARLELRGYLGMPMLGRTQVWERVE